jgi:hypothetical protein
MPLLVWSLLQFVLLAGAALAIDRAVWRRGLAIALLAAALLLPFHVPGPALVRALLAAPALLGIVKLLQLWNGAPGWSVLHRLWHAFMPFDVRATRRVTPGLDARLLGWTLLAAVLALGALAALDAMPRVLVLPRQLARLVLGGVFVYSGMEAATGAFRLVHGLFGIRVPRLQDRPIRALSIREFWNRRWNRPVTGWLATYVYAPVSARKGPEWGLFAGFVASGLLHAWMFLAAVGVIAAVSACLFFVFQALFVLVESAIDVRKASLGLRRTWTLGLLALSSPLFVDPVLRVLGL